MTQPLALLLYDKLLPGSQLVNRLQDLHYRVETISSPAELSRAAEHMKPLVVLVDSACGGGDVLTAVARLKQDPATQHLPVIGFAPDAQSTTEPASPAGPWTLLVSHTAILNYLEQILDQALGVE